MVFEIYKTQLVGCLIIHELEHQRPEGLQRAPNPFPNLKSPGDLKKQKEGKGDGESKGKYKQQDERQSSRATWKVVLRGFRLEHYS